MGWRGTVEFKGVAETAMGSSRWSRTSGRAHDGENDDPEMLLLTAIKTTHTMIWLSVELAMAYLLFTGLTRRSGRSVAAAGIVVAGESLVYLANGARCPLTQLAESVGTEHGSVTDIFLPSWLARNLPAIHVPLVALVAILHGRALLERRQERSLRRSSNATAQRCCVRSPHGGVGSTPPVGEDRSLPL